MVRTSSIIILQKFQNSFIFASPYLCAQHTVPLARAAQELLALADGVDGHNQNHVTIYTTEHNQFWIYATP